MFSQSQSDSTYLKQTKASGERFEFSFKNANPKAKKLMREAFFWSPIEESAPFGSDDGFEGAYGFREWRASHKSSDPLIYLKELISRWNYPYFDWNEMDTEKIKAYLKIKVMMNPADSAVLRRNLMGMGDSLIGISDSAITAMIESSSANMGVYYLVGQDNAIIGTAFAQLALEGWVAPDLKSLTLIAIRRELLPVLIDRWDLPYRKTREAQLLKMLEVIRKCD